MSTKHPLRLHAAVGRQPRARSAIASADSEAFPFFDVLPASGKWADLLGMFTQLDWWTAGTGPYYLVAQDYYSWGNYDFQVTPAPTSRPPTTPATPPSR